MPQYVSHFDPSTAQCASIVNAGRALREPSGAGLGYRAHGSAAVRTARHSGVCHDCDVTTILIVDDHPSFRASARAILEADGFEIVGEVADGIAALAAIEEVHPDVLLLDVQLPDMSGFEVCATLLARRNGSAPQVVIVSSRDACDFGSLIETSGARGFIAKAELSGKAVAALLR
jgi:CheY-like chemotaxis protein